MLQDMVSSCRMSRKYEAENLNEAYTPQPFFGPDLLQEAYTPQPFYSSNWPISGSVNGKFPWFMVGIGLASIVTIGLLARKR